MEVTLATCVTHRSSRPNPDHRPAYPGTNNPQPPSSKLEPTSVDRTLQSHSPTKHQHLHSTRYLQHKSHNSLPQSLAQSLALQHNLTVQIRQVRQNHPRYLADPNISSILRRYQLIHGVKPLLHISHISQHIHSRTVLHSSARGHRLQCHASSTAGRSMAFHDLACTG